MFLGFAEINLIHRDGMSKLSTPTNGVSAALLLHDILWEQKDSLSKKWIDIVHGSYPFETVGFLRTRKDQFANPVGYRTEQAAVALLDVLFMEKPDEEQTSKAIEEIIRVRAIQDFSPEVAVGIFFAIKDIVREVVKKSGQMESCLPALLDMESRVDAVVLIAFGLYARCREKLHLLKVEEFKRSHSQIVRLAQKKASLLEEADHQNP